MKANLVVEMLKEITTAEVLLDVGKSTIVSCTINLVL